jgi:putative membrane protein
VGEDPDPRFSLANERTFLAWVRTSLALLATGVALEVVGTLPDPVPLLFAGIGTIGPLAGWVGWARTERALRLDRPLPSGGLSVLVVAGTVLGGTLVAAGLPAW